MHRHDIFRGPSPIPLHGEVAEREGRSIPRGNPAGRGGDLLGHETLRTERAFVVGEDSRAGPQPMEASILNDLGEGSRLRLSVGIARPDRGRLVDRLAGVVAEHRRRPGKEQPRRQPRHPHRFEEIHRDAGDALERGGRLFERQRDRRLPGEVVELVGTDRLEERDGRLEVGRIECLNRNTPLKAERGEAAPVARRRIAARPHDPIPLVEEVRGEIRTVLAADAADERRRLRSVDACHGSPSGPFDHRCVSSPPAAPQTTLPFG